MSVRTAFQISYQPLFRLDILHLYFLNEGSTTFYSMSQAEKETQLEDFDLFREVDLIPTQETARKLEGQRMFLRKGRYYAEVLVECKAPDTPRIPIAPQLELQFLLVAKSQDWLELSNLPVEGTPTLSINTTSGPVISPAYFELGNASGILLPELSRNGASCGLADRLDQITNPNPVPVPQGTVALIQMKAQISGNHPGNLIQGSGQLTSPLFRLTFANRETVWKYHENGAWLVSQNKLPLTEGVIQPIDIVDGQGVPATRELPNPSRGQHKQDPNNPQELISEIYL